VTATAMPSHAQMTTYDDAWSHLSAPAANGECWHPTDAAFSERGFGYWAACPSTARAQTLHQPATIYRSMRPTHSYN